MNLLLMEQAPSQEAENTQGSPMWATPLRICYEYPLIWRNIFFSALFGTVSQERVECLSRHIGSGWGSSVDSITEALQHLDWLHQPRENRRGSLVILFPPLHHYTTTPLHYSIYPNSAWTLRKKRYDCLGKKSVSDRAILFFLLIFIG